MSRYVWLCLESYRFFLLFLYEKFFLYFQLSFLFLCKPISKALYTTLNCLLLNLASAFQPFELFPGWLYLKPSSKLHWNTVVNHMRVEQTCYIFDGWHFCDPLQEIFRRNPEPILRYILHRWSCVVSNCGEVVGIWILHGILHALVVMPSSYSFLGLILKSWLWIPIEIHCLFLLRRLCTIPRSQRSLCKLLRLWLVPLPETWELRRSTLTYWMVRWFWLIAPYRRPVFRGRFSRAESMLGFISWILPHTSGIWDFAERILSRRSHWGSSIFRHGSTKLIWFCRYRLVIFRWLLCAIEWIPRK